VADVSLVVREGSSAGSEHPVEGSLTLGREQDADLVLDDTGISRRHAAVQIEDGDATVRDLGSSNGTFVNGERVEGPRRLGEGDQIQLGDTVLEVRFSPEKTRVVPPPAGPTEVHAKPAHEPSPADRQPAPPRADTWPRAADEVNWPALGAIALGPLSIILLVFTSGALFYISLPCAIAAIALGGIGKRKVDRGETTRMRGMASAGRTFGIVGAVLSALVLLALVIVSAALDAGADNLRGLIDEVEAEIEGGASGVEVPEIESPQPDVEAPDSEVAPPQ
jgi:pSer/pThr/pTyr-binding forkhead associated (FHA) protein